MYIYLITNLVNGKYYVGQTIKKNIHARWNAHLREMRSGSNFRLHNAIRKYGTENFTIEMLTTATSWEQLNQLERIWIISLHSYDRATGYNMTMGGDGVKGYKHSAEARKKLSESHLGRPGWNKGKKMSPEFCAMMSQARKGRKSPMEGKKHSPEVIELLRKLGGRNKGRKGYKHTEEARKNISEAQRGRTHSEETKLKMSVAKKNFVFTTEHRAALKAAWVLRKERKATEIITCQ
jgi:group I intron endonuclease